MNNFSSKQVAQWMVEKLEKEDYLYQEDIVNEIIDLFGEPYYYTNDNGNFAISKEVLKEFRLLTPNVVWEKGDKCWRKREEYDDPNKRQSD